MRWTGILLAAGASRRMGQPKPLLLRQGVPLVRYLATTLLEGGFEQVVVVTGPERAAIAAALAGLPDTRLHLNPHPERGMLSSVHEGLVELPGGNGFGVCPCDLPLLRAADVAQILQRETTATAIVAPVWRGRRGHPTLFGPGLVEQVLALDPRVYGLNALLTRVQVTEVSVDHDGVVCDADTPEEWNALESRF